MLFFATGKVANCYLKSSVCIVEGHDGGKMKMEKEKDFMPSEKIIEDSITAGILEPLGCTVLPEPDETGHVQFRIIGDVDGCLGKLYKNGRIGSMEEVRAIKAARQAIFSCRSNGKGRNGCNSRS